VFANSRDGGLWQVSDAGGTPQQLTAVDAAKGEYGHRLPHVLPNGEAVLFTTQKASGDSQIVVRSLVTGTQKVLLEGGSDASYVSTGHVVYAQKGTLMAVPFDSTRLQLTGAPVGILDNLMQDFNTPLLIGNSGAAQFSVSESGTLAYLPGGISPERKASMLWVDRSGEEHPLPGSPGNFTYPRLSPDGKRLAFNLDFRLWIYDIDRGTQRPLMAAQRSVDSAIVWNPEGDRIAYFQPGGEPGIFRIASDGSAQAERLTTASQNQSQIPSSWSPDGKTLAFLQNGDIWVLTIGAESATARPFLQSSAIESSAEFSPDGQYLLYVSSEAGRADVNVRPYPGPGATITISTNGGVQPAWARSGREVFYLESGPGTIRGSRMMAVDIELGKMLKAGRPRMLFEGPYQPTLLGRMYDVANDGRRFLMMHPEEVKEAPITHIVLIQNWFEELAQRVPTK